MDDNQIKYINKMKKKFRDKLKGYNYVNLSEIKIGGYIKYINIYGDLNNGGIVLKKINDNKITNAIIYIKGINNNIWQIKYYKYHVFYKTHTTQSTIYFKN